MRSAGDMRLLACLALSTFAAGCGALAGEESVTPATKTFKAAGVDTKKTLSTFGEKNNSNY